MSDNNRYKILEKHLNKLKYKIINHDDIIKAARLQEHVEILAVKLKELENGMGK